MWTWSSQLSVKSQGLKQSKNKKEIFFLEYDLIHHLAMALPAWEMSFAFYWFLGITQANTIYCTGCLKSVLKDQDIQLLNLFLLWSIAWKRLIKWSQWSCGHIFQISLKRFKFWVLLLPSTLTTTKQIESNVPNLRKNDHHNPLLAQRGFTLFITGDLYWVTIS